MGVRGLRSALTAGYVVWYREVLRFARDWPRVFGALGQPLLYLFVLGEGVGSAFHLVDAPRGFSYVRFLYPGVIGMTVLFTSLLSGISLIQDREFGFLREILVAPVPRWAILLGKTAGGASTAVLQGAILILLAPLIGVLLTPLRVLELLLFMSLLALSLTAFALAVASRMTSLQAYQMSMNFLVMPMYFLSGALFPVERSIDWLAALMRVDPLMYGVDSLRRILPSPSTAALSPFTLRTDVLVLVAFGTAALAVGTVAFSRTNAH